jgi:cellulose synthase (UDP-forming)
MTVVSAPGAGAPLASLAVLPAAPYNEEKESYAWRSLPFLTVSLAISAGCTIVAQVLFEVNNPLLGVFFGVFTFIYLAYQMISIPVNFCGPSFDLGVHNLRASSWHPPMYPSVDVFLPICGEPLEVLRNTWEGVTELRDAYPGTLIPCVLDDGDSDEAALMADEFGFLYIRRPVHDYKKAGNLNYGLTRTDGQQVVIFDADFRPRSDFLAELLPYMDDGSLGIVQSPQFFRVDPGQTWVERAAGATLEVFYRSVQQARDRFGSALCVGSNAIYRRAALNVSGGFTVIPYAEDSHTGLDMRYHGYGLKYVPVPLAAGICPATIDMYMRQQYRWCNGATSLIWTRHMWRVPMPLKSRLPYIAGWLWNLTAAMRTLVVPLFPVVLLAVKPDQIQLRNVLLLLPAIMTGTILYPLWHNTRWPLGTWPLSIAVGWAQALALWDYSRGKVMSWAPSRGPRDATRRFQKAVLSWNGTLAVAWIGLAAYRIAQTGSIRFAFVALFGVINAVTVARIIFPGKIASS